MLETDYETFSGMLDGVCGLLSRGAYVPSSMNTALFFRALAKYDIREVRAAFDAHVADPQRGRFVPVPADLVAQIDGFVADDGRPGPEEAWATALRGADETVTIVWTEEAAHAWGVAKPVLNAGDEVGARMAFRESYGRLVEAARAQRKPPQWSPALGHDPAGRDAVIREAIALGRLPAADTPLLLEGPVESIGALALAAPSGTREGLLQLRDQIAMRETRPGPDADAKAETARLKAQADAMARQHSAWVEPQRAAVAPTSTEAHE